MRNTVDILGVAVDKVNMIEAVEKVKLFLSEERVHTIYTPNAEIMYDAYQDSKLRDILQAADLLIADGAGVVLASRILGRNLPEKVSGIDLTINSFNLHQEKNTKYFLFGSKPGIAEIAMEKLLKIYPRIEIAGCRNGYFTTEDDPAIIAQINSSNADILLVALGAPKQEKWIAQHKDALNVKICIGVGGSLDVFAGNVSLAPEFFRKNGLEWLYRLYKEPWRFKRMLKLPKFILLAITVKLKLKG